MSEEPTISTEDADYVTRRQRIKPPFVRVYFESLRHWDCQLIGEIPESIYDAIYPVLEKMAHDARMVVTESIVETEEDAAR